MLNMINTTIIFNAYGVSELSEIKDFPKFFDFLKKNYNIDNILNFIYELVDDNHQIDSNLLNFYNNIPTDIRNKMNNDMGMIETIKNIEDDNFDIVMKELENQTVGVVIKIKKFISKIKIKLSLYEKGQQMLNSYDEENFQNLKKEIEKNDKKEVIEGAKILFQKSNLKLQIKYFKVEVKSLKDEIAHWENQIEKSINDAMTVECVDKLLKLEDDENLINILLEKRQKLKKIKSLFDKIIKKNK